MDDVLISRAKALAVIEKLIGDAVGDLYDAHNGIAALTPATDGRAEGLREAVEWLLSEYDAPNDIDDAVGKLRTAFRAAALPAWQPPPESERPEGYRCLGWLRNEWREVEWGKSFDGDSKWFKPATGHVKHPTAFHPLLPAPAQEGEQ